MKKIYKTLILTLIGVNCFTSCNKDIEGEYNNDSNKENIINFTTGINSLSRTSIADGNLTTSFTANDSIGIFVYEGDDIIAKNVKYVYNGSSWTSENPLTAKDGVQYKYYAYYPYRNGVTDITAISVNVSEDQTAGISNEDFLTARNETSAAGAENISLNFSHSLSMIQVGIKDGVTADANATITLENILPAVTVNAKTGEISAASGETVSIKMKKSEQRMEYRAIIPAQVIVAGSRFMSITADGKPFDVNAPAEISLNKGQALQITVNSLVQLPEGEQITIGGAINDWGNGENPGESEVTEMPLINAIGTELPEVVMDTRNFNEESWFKLVQSDDERGRSTFEIVEDNATTWGKAVKLTYNINKEEGIDNSWYKATIGYNHTEPMYVTDEVYIYKVTAKVKADVCDEGSTISKLVFTCKAKSSDRYKYSFAAGTKPDTFTATTVSIPPASAGTWEELTFYINFKQLSSTVGGEIYGTDDKKFFVDATPEDYNGFDLRIYTSNKGLTPVIYISDVKIEQYKNE
ncbi:fimbrillin family protein [Bacteroides caecigallinarum]|uniref:fimbrillin family protein n=1 Tax=Bacteroides caecigallinarum TaxID=1411144 RepID=UPI00195E3599|nr:fimbrillin family protein [Bacteroides caecigallinarum]MBM6962100.1 fimbrillin family protein [Bacteroides caecigallinarum]